MTEMALDGEQIRSLAVHRAPSHPLCEAAADRRLLVTSKRIRHTGRMMALDQQTWTTLAALATFALGLFGYLATIRRDLKSEIAATRTELKTELGKVEDRLISLENRTYDISTRLPATATGSSAG